VTALAGTSWAAGKPGWVTWEDPRERGFTVLVPRGWKVQGGTYRPSLLIYQTKVAAASPDGEVRLFLGDTFPWYVEPSRTLAFFGIREGGIYTDSLGSRWPVRRYCPGARYLTTYVLGNRKLKVKMTNRPELAKAVGLAALGANVHSGEVSYEFQRGGKVYRGGWLCTTARLPYPGGLGACWFVVGIAGYEAPKAREKEARQALLRVYLTWRVNPIWAAAQAKGSRDRQAIVAKMGRDTARTISETYWARQKVMDLIFKMASDARRGQLDLYDPVTGTTYYGRTNKFKYYWVNGLGKIVGTNTDTRPAFNYRRLAILP
jgi:hypothetical protein